MGFSTNEFPFSSEYDSDLREVLRYIREVVAKIDTYDEIIAELKEELENIQNMDDRLDALEAATSDLPVIRLQLEGIEQEITNIINQHSTDVSRLQREIDAIRVSISNFENDIEAARAYSLYLYNKVKYELEGEIANTFIDVYATVRAMQKEVSDIRKRIDNIDTSVLNPWHPELGRISQDRNAKCVYGDLADECLTAEQYCKLGLTAAQYAAFDIPAIWYAEFGKTKLHFNYVYSPVFGYRQDINVVLTSILNGIMDTLTASEYAALDLDADSYSALGLDAWDYFSFMADEGYLKLGGSGITAAQYQTLTT